MITLFFMKMVKKSDKDLKKYIANLENAGCGEIILTSIDREVQEGFDIELYKLIQNEVHLNYSSWRGFRNRFF